VTDGSCEEDRACFGVLKAQSYRAEYFDPVIRFSIPHRGYVNTRSSGGIVNIISVEAPGDEITLFQRASPRTADDKPVAGVGTSVRDFVSWLTARDDLLVTKPKATTLGGLHGMWMDIAVREDAGSAISDCPGDPCVLIAYGIDDSEHATWAWDVGIWRGAAVRAYVLDAGTERLLVTVFAWDGSDLENVVAEFQPIIDSIRFES
jgi:hypothetical protein